MIKKRSIQHSLRSEPAMRLLLEITAALLLAPALAVAETADASTAAPPALEVTLVQAKPLALVRSAAGGKLPWLDGVLVATVTNRSQAPVRLRDLGEHGVVFVEPSGALRVLVHSCKCVKDAVEPAEASFELAPGASRTVTVDDWGCGGGMWAAPPPGRYQVEYRVLPAPAVQAPAEEEQPQVQVERCRQEFSSPRYWEGATGSKPLALELRAPRGKRR